LLAHHCRSLVQRAEEVLIDLILPVAMLSGERKEKCHIGLGLGLGLGLSNYPPLEEFGEGAPTMHALRGDLTRIFRQVSRSLTGKGKPASHA